MAGRADGPGQRRVIDAFDRWLAGGIERREDDAVGILEAAGELLEEIAHARVAVRLHDGDDAAAYRGSGGPQHGSNLDGMMSIVVVNRHAVPGARELEAPSHAGEARNGAADDIVADVGLGRHGNGSK